MQVSLGRERLNFKYLSKSNFKITKYDLQILKFYEQMLRFKIKIILQKRCFSSLKPGSILAVTKQLIEYQACSSNIH